MDTKHQTILPVTEPLETTWATDSQLFSVILQSANGYKWVMNHYVQMTTKNNFERVMPPGLRFLPTNDYIYSWPKCPLLEFKKIGRHEINAKWGSVIDFFIETIQEGYYIYLYMDRDYLIEKDKRKYVASCHINFIYGYDPVQQCFFIADHFNEGKYSRISAGFTDVANAYYSEKLNFNENNYENWVALIKFNDCDYEFDIPRLKKLLYDYLHSQNSFAEYYCPLYIKSNSIYGLKCYDALIKYMDDIQNGVVQTFDHRPFTLMRDHKYMMGLRIDFLRNEIYPQKSSEFEDIKKAYDSLYQQAINMLNLVLKAIAAQNVLNLSRIKQILMEMRTFEEIYLEKLIGIIE